MAISDLSNLGLKSQEMLAHAGVTSVERLRGLGSVAAFTLVRQSDARPSLNLLWALEGA